MASRTRHPFLKSVRDVPPVRSDSPCSSTSDRTPSLPWNHLPLINYYAQPINSNQMGSSPQPATSASKSKPVKGKRGGEAGDSGSNNDDLFLPDDVLPSMGRPRQKDGILWPRGDWRSNFPGWECLDWEKRMELKKKRRGNCRRHGKRKHRVEGIYMEKEWRRSCDVVFQPHHKNNRAVDITAEAESKRGCEMDRW
ncbi:hypothetical protein ACLOJK_033862 [Asimina triloba]